jgi:hypothetical protein
MDAREAQKPIVHAVRRWASGHGLTSTGKLLEYGHNCTACCSPGWARPTIDWSRACVDSASFAAKGE